MCLNFFLNPWESLWHSQPPAVRDSTWAMDCIRRWLLLFTLSLLLLWFIWLSLYWEAVSYHPLFTSALSWLYRYHKGDLSSRLNSSSLLNFFVYGSPTPQLSVAPFAAPFLIVLCSLEMGGWRLCILLRMQLQSRSIQQPSDVCSFVSVLFAFLTAAKLWADILTELFIIIPRSLFWIVIASSEPIILYAKWGLFSLLWIISQKWNSYDILFTCHSSKNILQPVTVDFSLFFWPLPRKI